MTRCAEHEGGSRAQCLCVCWGGLQNLGICIEQASVSSGSQTNAQVKFLLLLFSGGGGSANLSLYLNSNLHVDRELH